MPTPRRGRDVEDVGDVSRPGCAPHQRTPEPAKNVLNVPNVPPVHPVSAQRAAEGRLPARSLIEECLGMTLAELERSDRCLEVAVPGLRTTLWFVPGPDAVERLRLNCIRRGRIWTAAELRDLMAAPGMTHEDALAIARAKLGFNATVAAVRPDPLPTAGNNATPQQPQPRQSSLDLDVSPTQEHDR